MSDISKEVAELCQSILLFQKNLTQLKQNLFIYPEVTDVLIWNHLVGGQHSQLNKQMLVQILKSKGVSYSEKSITLLFFQYSTLKNKILSKKQFLSIFIDQRRKFMDQILASRNNKFSYAKNHTPHYKITQLLLDILKKTLNFLQLKQKMKENIYLRKKDQNFIIKQINSQHLLVYLNQNLPLWSTKQCQIVISHMIKYHNRSLKQFYYFFIPYSCKSTKINPDSQILKKTQHIQSLKTTYSSLIDHRKASNFGNKLVKLRKTLYLK